MTPELRKRSFFPRFVSALLIVSLVSGTTFLVPDTAFSLRPMPDTAGLEEALQQRAGLEEPAEGKSNKEATLGALARPQEIIESQLRNLLKPEIQEAYSPHLPKIAEVIDSVYRDDPRRNIRMPWMIKAVAHSQTLIFNRLGKKGSKAFHEALLSRAIPIYQAAPGFLVEAARLLTHRIRSDAPRNFNRFFEDAAAVVEFHDFDLFEWRYKTNEKISDIAASIRLVTAGYRDSVNKVRETMRNGETFDVPKLARKEDALPFEGSPAERWMQEEGEWRVYLLKHLPTVFIQKLRQEAPEEVAEFVQLFDAIEEKMQEVESIAKQLGDPFAFALLRDRLEEIIVEQIFSYVSTASSAYSALSRVSVKLNLENFVKTLDQHLKHNRAQDAWKILKELSPGKGIVHSAELTIRSREYDYFPGLISMRHVVQEEKSLKVRVKRRFLILLDQSNHLLMRRVSAFPAGVFASPALFLADGEFEGLFKVRVDREGRVLLYQQEEGLRSRKVMFHPTVDLAKKRQVFLEVKAGLCSFIDGRRRLLGRMKVETIRKRLQIESEQALEEGDLVRIFYPGEHFYIETMEEKLRGITSLDDIKSRLAQGLHLLKQVYPELSLQRILSSTTTLGVESMPGRGYLAWADGRGTIAVNLHHSYSPLVAARVLIHEDQHNFYIPLKEQVINDLINPAVRAKGKRFFKEKAAAEAVAEEIYETMSRLSEVKFLVDALRAGLVTFGQAKESLEEVSFQKEGLPLGEQIVRDLEDLDRLGERGFLSEDGKVYASAMRETFEGLKREIDELRDVILSEPPPRSAVPKLTHEIIPRKSELGRVIEQGEFISSIAEEPLRRYMPEALPLSERLSLPSGVMKSLPSSTAKALPPGGKADGEGPGDVAIDREASRELLEQMISPRRRAKMIEGMGEETPDRETLDALGTFFRNYLGEKFVESHQRLIVRIAQQLPSASSEKILGMLTRNKVPKNVREAFRRTWLGTGSIRRDSDWFQYEDDTAEDDIREVPQEGWSHDTPVPFDDELDDATGLEEQRMTQVITIYAEAAQGPGVVVLETGVLAKRAGLEELIRRLPPALAKRVVTFEGDDLHGLAAALMAKEGADRITYIGLEENAKALAQMLPPSMTVLHKDPTIGLEEIFLALGVPQEVLRQVNISGLEETFARSRAA